VRRSYLFVERIACGIRRDGFERQVYYEIGRSGRRLKILGGRVRKGGSLLGCGGRAWTPEWGTLGDDGLARISTILCHNVLPMTAFFLMWILEFVRNDMLTVPLNSDATNLTAPLFTPTYGGSVPIGAVEPVYMH
jgi:hypothetical protein